MQMNAHSRAGEAGGIVSPHLQSGTTKARLVHVGTTKNPPVKVLLGGFVDCDCNCLLVTLQSRWRHSFEPAFLTCPQSGVNALCGGM